MGFLRMIVHLGLILTVVTLAMTAPVTVQQQEVEPVLDGGFTPEKTANAANQALADLVKSQVEKKLGLKTRSRISQYKVLSVKSQIVSGTNYWMKIQIGPNEYIHVRVFEPFKQFRREPKVATVKENMKHSDLL
ncbi:hypothetical protein RvY_11234-1 [Ramazzottius varieornatus]|uniref:Cystatin domain-containing protein n=1 Tax=Ramazzottius varieornatus TaxID=947166 RepID=A0A1D1VFG6_RAMVA|nr:hypothetical protein RvY_11234-1 [Ramazzottius varieornatus]